MIARLARTVPIAGTSLMVAALALAQLGLSSPLTAFGLATLGWLGGGVLGSVCGLLALRWSPDDPKQRRGARIGLAASGALLAGLLWIVRGVRGPAIHDISTDTADAPAFEAARATPANAQRDLSYPHGDPRTPQAQREAYPDLRSIRLAVAPDAALEAVVDAASALGWQIVTRDAGHGRVEATATTRLFRFVDDIVVRVRPDGSGSLIDVRSTSRVGRSDLGANATRIRRFAAELGDPFD